MGNRLAGYEYFLTVAGKVSWDDRAIDLTGDAKAWSSVPPGERDRLAGLLGAFAVAEEAVACTLGPFAASAESLAALCFEVQANDEERHARFFDRVTAEVIQTPGGSPAERREQLRPLVPAQILELFECELPARAQALASGTGSLAEAVGLYHLVLEGVVLNAGELLLVDALRSVGCLPGVLAGVERVVLDERWHIGFGARCALDAGVDESMAATILASGNRAATAWAGLGVAGLAASAARLHRRRLRAVGLGVGTDDDTSLPAQGAARAHDQTGGT